METIGLTLQRDSLIRLREPSNAGPIWCLANFQAMVVSDNRDFGRITAFCGGGSSSRVIPYFFVFSGQFEFLVDRCGGARIASSN